MGAILELLIEKPTDKVINITSPSIEVMILIKIKPLQSCAIMNKSWMAKSIVDASFLAIKTIAND